MNCLECQELLQKSLDGERIAASAMLDQHLGQCTPCREQHAAAARLVEGLRHVPKPKPPANFTQILVAEVMRDRRQRQGRMRRRVFVTTALAASVLLILFTASWLLPRSRTDEGQPVVAYDRTRAIPSRNDSAEPKDPDNPEPRHALSALTDRLADTTRDHAKVVQVAMNLDGMDKLPAVNELTVDPSVREAGQEVSDGVRSVTRNTRRAFDFFARELPMPAD
jgi:hypothetical protein